MSIPKTDSHMGISTRIIFPINSSSHLMTSLGDGERSRRSPQILCFNVSLPGGESYILWMDIMTFEYEILVS